MDYANFDLWVDPAGENRYRLRAVSDVTGETQGYLQLDPQSKEIQRARELVIQRETSEEFLTYFGTVLFQGLFSDEIKEDFRTCNIDAQRRGKGVRLRLRLEPPEVASLPWEFLYYPAEQCFLATQVATPVVRYLELRRPISDIETPLPVRLLIVIPGYSDPDLYIDVAQEKANLQRGLEGVQDTVEPVFIEGNVTLADLADVLLEQRFHCFHFIGHGDFTNDRGCLLFNAEDGGVDFVDEDRFTQQFINHPSMKLVVLNSCKGASVSSNNAFAGIAPRLVMRGIPAVIAMQYAVYDEAAVEFSKTFYMSLFSGWNKGAVDFAVSQARMQLKSKYPNERELGTPVLFMRARDGILFDPLTGSRTRDALMSADRSRKLRRQYEENITLLQDARSERNDQKTADEVAKTTAELARLTQRFRLRNGFLGVGTSVIMLMFFFSWIELFDYLDFKMESYTLGIARPFTETIFNDRIVTVTISEHTERSVGRAFDRSWRQEHAILVEKISSVGASVVAFDFYFENETEFDQGFIKAIEVAKSGGTAVVLGYRDVDGHTPKVVEGLGAAVSALGVVCVGAKFGLSRSAALAVVKDRKTPMPSLALAALMTDRNDVISGIDWSRRLISLLDAESGLARQIGFSEHVQNTQSQPRCPAIGKGDEVADLVLDRPPKDVSQNGLHNIAYEKAITLGDDDARRLFKDKIVFVGAATLEDSFTLHASPNESRFGVELHAQALNDMLQGVTIRPLGELGQLIVMSLLGLVGALIRYWTPPSRHMLRWCLVLVTLALCLAATVYLYAQYRVLLNSVYPVGALLFTYWATGKLERQWAA